MESWWRGGRIRFAVAFLVPADSTIDVGYAPATPQRVRPSAKVHAFSLFVKYRCGEQAAHLLSQRFCFDIAEYHIDVVVGWKFVDHRTRRTVDDKYVSPIAIGKDTVTKKEREIVRRHIGFEVGVQYQHLFLRTGVVTGGGAQLLTLLQHLPVGHARPESSLHRLGVYVWVSGSSSLSPLFPLVPLLF